MLELTYKRILLIALPLMFGTFVQSMIAIIDAGFVSELGNTAYNAVGNGSIMYIVLFMLCRGLADGSQITIAKKLGERKNREIGKVLFNAHFLQLIIASLCFTLLFLFGETIIKSIAKSELLGDTMTQFIKYRSWGIFFAALQISLMAFFIGLGKTKIIIYSTLILALTNIFLDYSLIFGHYGFPKLGMIGAPIASSSAEAVSCLFLLLVALKAKSFRQFGYSLKLKIQSSYIKPLLKLSIPLMLQGLVSLLTWLIFFSMIENLGAENLEVAHNIRYMYFLAFIPIFGYAAATKTYISNLVGRSEQHLIPKTQLKLTLLSLASILLIFHGALLYPKYLIGMVDHNPDITPEILKNSTDALRFVTGSIIIFAISIVPFNSVSALGKTQLAFAIECFSIGLYLIGCYLFIELWKWNIVDVWWVEYIYFGSLGITSGLFLYLKRKQFGFVTQKNTTDYQ